MATLTGKKARRTGGNRYACKRRNRHRNTNVEKRWRWREMERERKRRKGGFDGGIS